MVGGDPSKGGIGRGEAPETVIAHVQIYDITLHEEAMARARARRGGGEQDDSFVGRMEVAASRVGGRGLEGQKGLSAPTPSAELVVIKGSEKNS